MINKLFLLSEAEYLKYKNVLWNDLAWSWLRTPADSDDTGRAFVKTVIENGSVIDYWVGDSQYVHIRPACYVCNVQRFLLSNQEWIVADKEKRLLVSGISFGTRCFDRVSNQYVNSDILNFLQSVYDSMDMCDKDNMIDAFIEGELSKPLL